MGNLFETVPPPPLPFSCFIGENDGNLTAAAMTQLTLNRSTWKFIVTMTSTWIIFEIQFNLIMSLSGMFLNRWISLWFYIAVSMKWIPFDSSLKILQLYFSLRDDWMKRSAANPPNLTLTTRAISCRLCLHWITGQTLARIELDSKDLK